MEIKDEEIEKLEIKGSPRNFAKLIIEYLCGRGDYEPSDEDLQLLNLLLRNIDDRIQFNQFNEILLLLNRDTISEPFFNIFFDEDGVTLDELKKKITDFRGYALLCLGNFRFAYKELSKKGHEEIKKFILPFCLSDEDIINDFEKRPNIMINIDEIPRERTWLTGYISSKEIQEDIDSIKLEFKDAREKDDVRRLEELLSLSNEKEKIRDELIKYKKVAIKNTNIYLTWDYIDIYVATSMRNKWEFEETYEFIKKIFKEENLKKLQLRYFNPTQSFCISPKDKGLLEGLMLKRSKCTIYLAQESDTMGKDSELATTLVQGKPVIAYVPDIDVKKYSQKIHDYPLDYFKKRILIQTASELYDDPNVKSILMSKYPEYKNIINDFLKKLEEYEDKQIFLLGTENDEIEFKKEFKEFQQICKILSEVERIHFNKRARTLKEAHPLSMQIALKNGVSNGVLVARTPEKCSKLLYGILTNKLKFHIKRMTFDTYGLEEKVGSTVLLEDISESPFRIITDYEKLTNSFWNLYPDNL